MFTRFKIKIKRFFFQCINELDIYRVLSVSISSALKPKCPLDW